MRILSRLPGSLSRPAGTAENFTPSDTAYSYAIGGTPWLAAANKNRPIRRQTAPIRKQQFDAQPQAGEQSLDGYWYRSQMSFHGGAGQAYNDPIQRYNYNNPTAPDLTEIRFYDSAGVDVWTPGRITLLAQLTKVADSAVVGLVGYTTPTGKNMVVRATGTTVAQRSADGTYSGSTAGPAAETIVAVCTDGTRLFIATAVGIYSSPLPDGNGSFTWTKIWNTGSSAVKVGWVKQRLVATIGAAVYELVGTGPTLPTAKYTHPNAGWTWTAISETGSAIYASGYAGGTSAIYKFIPSTTDGSMPTLSSGIVAASLPDGENVHAVYGYLGNYLAIGTSKGVRVAQSGQNGDLEYGPLTVETASPVRCFTARDRFLFYGLSAGVGGNSGLGRIDLGNAVGPLRFAYATDVFYSGAASGVSSCAHIGNSQNLALGTDSDGLLFMDGSGTKVATGWLQTSKIRYTTLEPKLFKLLRVRGPALQGSLGVSTVSSVGTEYPLYTIGEGTTPGSEDVELKEPRGPQEYISVKFILNRGSVTTTQGAEMSSYQIKALPGTPRQRIIQFPVLCFDFEQDRNGQVQGGPGTALARLQALEDVEGRGDIVLWQDFAMDRNTLCVIEQLDFVQTAPPNGAEGWGGYLNITVRTL